MRFLIFLCCFIAIKCYASSYNIYPPVSYFTNQKDTIAKLRNLLEYHGIASITGVRGNGKTELVKKYFSIYQRDYEIIGYFNGAISIIPQLLTFAEYINSGLEENNKISLDPATIQDSIIEYLRNRNNWLLIFDNLSLNNAELNRFLDLKDKGHIVFISANKIQKSSNDQIIINNLQIEHVKGLLNKVMQIPDQEVINELAEVLVQKGSPTALIVDSAYFLNNHPHYTVKEYIKKMTNDNELVKNYLEMTMSSLSMEAKKLLTKIALLNNQAISKNIISNILDKDVDVNEVITELSSTNLLRMINTDRNNPIFGLHDIYKNELLKLPSNKEIIVRELISSLNKIFPDNFKYGNEIHHIFLNDQTLAGNIEMLLENIEKYSIKPTYEVLELRLNTLINAFELSFMDQAEEHIQWFKKSFLSYNIMPKTLGEKQLFSTFLIHLSASEFFIYMDTDKALQYLFLARDIINNEKDNNDLKSYISIDIGQIQAYLGDLESARNSIETAEKLVSYNSNSMVKILFVKSLIYLMEGNYHSALAEIIKEVELCKDLGHEEEWPAVTGQKAKILNGLGRFKDAYHQTYKLYTENYQLIRNNDTDKGDILTQLSRAELGINKPVEALEHAKLAVSLLLGNKKRNNKSLNLSTDFFLAEALVAYGDSLSSLNEWEKALNEYNKAERIYKNVYKDNFNKVDNVSYLLLQVAKVSHKLGNGFWYKHYNNLLTKILPAEHYRIKELNDYVKSGTRSKL